MATQASPKLAAASAGVHDGRGPESRFATPVLPLDDAPRRASATPDPGAIPPGHNQPRTDLSPLKADLQAVTADLDHLRGRLLQALNKGLVLNELGGILDRLDHLWQSIADGTGPEPDAGPSREASWSLATGQAPGIPK